MQDKISLKEKGVEIKTLFSGKYKTNLLNLNFMLPMTEENISRAHVLASVLLRGSQKYQTVKEIGRKLNMLYSPDVAITSYKTSTNLVFKVSVSFIDGKFLPSGEGENVFAELTEILYELLGRAFPSDTKLLEKYTQSEKKQRMDIIRAEKNNKDAYAFSRCQRLLFDGSPLGFNGKGTEECVAEITPDILRQMLSTIISSAPVFIIYAGNPIEEGKLVSFADRLLGKRKAEDIVYPKIPVPSFDFESKEVCEEADALQGRTVCAYKLGDFSAELCKTELFNEILGASPVSRLFMNVREKLHLCYYCASNTLESLGITFVRSGISNENREKCASEINTQIELLKNSKNISNFEFDAAVRSIRNNYLTLTDDTARYANWVTYRYMDGRSDDVSDYIKSIESLTKEDVADVAKSASLKLDYFLKGNAERTGNL